MLAVDQKLIIDLVWPNEEHSYFVELLWQHSCMHVHIIMHVFMSDAWAGQGCPHSGTNNTNYEDPQGPGTMLLKSGTVPEIRTVEAYALLKPH